MRRQIDGRTSAPTLDVDTTHACQKASRPDQSAQTGLLGSSAMPAGRMIYRALLLEGRFCCFDPYEADDPTDPRWIRAVNMYGLSPSYTDSNDTMLIVQCSTTYPLILRRHPADNEHRPFLAPGCLRLLGVHRPCANEPGTASCCHTAPLASAKGRGACGIWSVSIIISTSPYAWHRGGQVRWCRPGLPDRPGDRTGCRMRA
jgi:hypothetical protein